MFLLMPQSILWYILIEIDSKVKQIGQVYQIFNDHIICGGHLEINGVHFCFKAYISSIINLINNENSCYLSFNNDISIVYPFLLQSLSPITTIRFPKFKILVNIVKFAPKSKMADNQPRWLPKKCQPNFSDTLGPTVD